MLDTTADIELRSADFAAIRALVLENTGISLAESKRELVKRRFAPRLRELGLDDFTTYIEYVRSNFAIESPHFCNAITTNLTSFFREGHHYDFLENEVLPRWLESNAGRHRQRLRLWSAGCSTGQEAYCLAITLLKTIPDAHLRDIRILATDLDENCLEKGRLGAYEVREFDKVDRTIVKEFFSPATLHVKNIQREALMAKDQLKSLITFNKLNLIQNWPMQGKFDIIFCRNVFIYFDKPTQEKIISRYADYQTPGSILCLGHSETVASPESLGYELIGKTTYRRIGGVR